MATFPNFDTSNSSELELGVLLDFIPISESQRQNGNRNNMPVTTNSLMSPTTLTSQASHNFYQSINNMLPTPEGSGSDNNAVCPETLILSPYNMLPGSGQLTIEDHDDVSLFYFFFRPGSFIIDNNILFIYFTVLFGIPRI